MASWKMIVVIAGVALLPGLAAAQVWVNPYQRQNGAWVQGHERTRPDGNPTNNYGYPGNLNPNTGRITPGNPYAYPQPQPRGYTLGR